ncbi:KdsC family phosphatase [Aquicella lusitana]|uniref:3-deoxy-D-manno-octulosonate 8-phosphate phosphatase KdsC n=1 Tax=Aquicella lusitana TaxID=254246 RepID=A0A370GYP9_9COXI|nr:HAD-IIIA family hydrolase [Aquicella lusitana]RDI48783.1 3-deoxy-D-manno-octulosonate 8-phosphate phosphatase (KDO 8-P phosphatase) [Aquicella lusitana]VVC73211.1 3-deoxy-D-manno-octulosonate 8-phosphate phosphatase KdsC [Aquicella lusitana]
MELVEKAKSIRLLILDIDGILTTGILYYGNQGIEVKGFSIYDGLGIKLLQKTGVQVAVISGKTSEAVLRRMRELNIEYAYLGQDDKLPAYEELKEKLQLNDQEIAYMGDDLPDLPLLRRAGFAITVPKAPTIIKQHADLITKTKAGKGAVREICEFIMEAQGQYQSVIQSYLTK